MSVSRETAPAALPPSSTSVSRETECHDHEAQYHRDERPAGPAAALLLLPIRAYRRFLSPALTPRCRYHPSCSAYAEEAIRELGPLRGVVLAAWRLLRCNPLSAGGLDPVSERRLFRERLPESPVPERSEAA